MEPGEKQIPESFKVVSKSEIVTCKRSCLSARDCRNGYNFKCMIIPIAMESLYILINCDLGAEIEIIQELAKIPEVVEVRGTYGIYDIFAKVQAGNKEILEEIITNKIRRISRVRSTVTLTPIMSQGGR